MDKFTLETIVLELDGIYDSILDDEIEYAKESILWLKEKIEEQSNGANVILMCEKKPQ